MTDAAIFCATWTLRAVLAASSLSALVVTLSGALWSPEQPPRSVRRREAMVRCFAPIAVHRYLTGLVRCSRYRPARASMGVRSTCLSTKPN